MGARKKIAPQRACRSGAIARQRVSQETRAAEKPATAAARAFFDSLVAHIFSKDHWHPAQQVATNTQRRRDYPQRDQSLKSTHLRWIECLNNKNK